MDLLLVRRLRPYHTNTKKRLVKSLKGYVRDSGVTHALLGITGSDRCASPTGMVTPGFLPFGDTCTSLYIVGEGREQDAEASQAQRILRPLPVYMVHILICNRVHSCHVHLLP
jgi:meiotically up-regulated gene 157 (Mug157) protein